MIGSTVRVFLAVGPVDLRGAFDRLAAVTREVLREDPKSGALYFLRGSVELGCRVLQPLRRMI